MEGFVKKEEACPQLLDLIPRNKEWVVSEDQHHHHGSSEERKLELRLGPPGEDWSMKPSNGYFTSMSNVHGNGKQNQTQKFSSISDQNPFLQFPSMAKESSQSQTCCTKVAADLQESAAEKKAFSISSSVAANTAVPNKTSQKRTAPAPVVGWPPIRSFRKNLASTSSSLKPVPESQNGVPNKVGPSEKPAESSRKGLFVKINMDGVPIGRKVDLKAYDSYEKLSIAVDELFRGLLAAQRDSSAGGIENMQEEEKPITGVLDGTGEYTLVYEDNEGDRMLVGDVPWHMFVSTVKRLRVLKSSELSALTLGNKQHKMVALDSAQ